VPAEKLLKALQMVLNDEGFSVPSSEAARAFKAASELISWYQEEANKISFHKFSQWLHTNLEICFRPYQSLSKRVERMWEEYHKLRTNKIFREEWDKFLEASVGEKQLPTLYQYVTHQIFKELIQNKYAIPETGCSAKTLTPLTWEEENALRYVAGYVCRRVQESLKRSTRPDKEKMVLFMIHLSGDEDMEERGTETWTDSIDRGGLWHVNDITYTVFYHMEEEIRSHLQVKLLDHMDDKTRENIAEAMLANEDILFQWSLLSTAIDDISGKVILQMLAKLYLTVRGFAFAASCLEMYKQRHKRKTQKSKGLRKKLIATE
jgi:hypothetical protein